MTDQLLEETLKRVLAKHSGPSDRQRAEAEGWLPTCWDALAEAGFVWLGVGEAAGGSGGGVTEAALLVRLAGAHAVPLPLAECALLGGWLVEQAGLTLPAGPVTVAVPRRGDDVVVDAHGRLSGRLQRVPWGRRAAVVAIARGQAGPMAVLVDPLTAAVTAGTNMAGEPRDRLDLDDVAIAAQRTAPVDDEVVGQLELRGALSRALLLAGAAGSASALTVSYASERRQFGRPVAAFQAVAHRMVRMASEAEAALLAAAVAAHRFAELGWTSEEAAAAVALAKAAVTRSAAEVAADAHQVHGAIGMTQEYPLHHFTRRIWAWSHEWGSERHWNARIGESVATAGAEALWPRVAIGLTAS